MIKFGLHFGFIGEFFDDVVGVIIMLILVLDEILSLDNIISIFLMVLQLNESVALSGMLLGFFVVMLLLGVAAFVVGGADALAAIEVMLDRGVIALVVFVEESSIVAIWRKLGIMELLMVIIYSLNILRRISNRWIVGGEVVGWGLVTVDFIPLNLLILQMS